MPDADLRSQRRVVDAFLAAARDGDFDALVAVLDPHVVLRADRGTAMRQIRGAHAAAEQALTFQRIAESVRPALVNGAAGLLASTDGRPHAVLSFTITAGKIVEINILADPQRLRQLDLADNNH